MFDIARIAQLVEQHIGNVQVSLVRSQLRALSAFGEMVSRLGHIQPFGVQVPERRP